MSSLFGTLREKVSQLSILDNGSSSSQNNHNNDLIYSRKRTKDELFTEQFRLPDSESMMCETSAEVSLSSGPGSSTRGNVSYQGKLYLSESFLIFSSLVPDDRQFNFTLPLITVKKVERLPSKSYIFALSIHLYHGMKIVIQFVGLRSQCEHFCQILKENLTRNLGLIDQLKSFLKTFYSEFLLETLESSDTNDQSGAAAPPLPPRGGLGQTFRYPGDPRKLRDKSKMRLWLEYLREHGRNITLVKQPGFYKLIRVGLPNRLRGEIWEVCCGSIFLRMENPTQYESLWEEFQGRQSQATEEIEKDLNRSLPSYKAYQDPEGIARLRRVLTVYSWKNPEVGYCQAMNIVVAAFLIYMSEEQTYWCLNVLCDKLLPGYYSKTMYGTLLDQKVLEALVAKTMPILWEHMTKQDMQLSIVSLPWFLSLFINSMPLVFAFRIVDVFFLEGSKTLFQVALAILRINGEDILDAEDDGQLIAIIKKYFSTLDQPAHPNSKNEKLRTVTRFQELMVVAFREFSVVTDDMIREMRSKNEGQVLRDIELFAKRTQLRNIRKPNNLNMEQMGIIYDRFYSVLQDTRLGFGSAKTHMGIDAFVVFLGGIIDWMDPRRLSPGQGSSGSSPESVNDPQHRRYNDLVYRLFKRWDSQLLGSLSLSDIIHGLDKLVDPDLMTQIAYFFELYDDDGTGDIEREGVLQMSEGLLFLTRPWREEPVLMDIVSRGLIEANKREVAEAKARLAEQEQEAKIKAKAMSKDKTKSTKSEVSEDSLEDDHTNTDARSIKSVMSTKSNKSNKSNKSGSSVSRELVHVPTLLSMDTVKHEQSIRYLSAVSNFLQRSFEYAITKNESTQSSESLIEVSNDGDNNDAEKSSKNHHNAALNPDTPLFMNLATFRMVLLADETLEMLFSQTLRDSVHITTTGTGSDQLLTKPKRNITLRGVFDGLVNDSIRVAGEVRRRIDEIDARMADDDEEGDVTAVKQGDRDLLDD